MYAATSATHVEDALRLMGIELSKMAAADNDEAVHRGRNKCLVNLVRARETPFDAARMVGTAMLTFGTIVSPEDEIDRIRSVTTRDVREAASTLIDMAKPTIAVVGQPEPIDYEEVMLTAIRSVLGSTSSDR
jgi:predicted Zn-dependent peptidase